MRRLMLMALIPALTLAARDGHAQQQENPNIKNLRDALDYLKSDKSTDRAFALATMGLMKEDAKSASKQIVAGFFDSSPDVRQAAALALQNVNPPLYKPVVALTGNDYSAKVQAVKDLGALGADAAPTVPALLGFLKDARATDRVEIIKTVVEIAPKDESLAAVLAQLALKDPDAAVRASALKNLPGTANPASQLQTALDALDAAETPAAKMDALNLVGTIGKGNQDAATILKNYLNDSSPQVREAAKKALTRLKGGK